jgi:hypothetical protein
MFATTRFVAVMTEIFLRLIESGNRLLVIRGSAGLSMEKNGGGWKDGRMEGWKIGSVAALEARSNFEAVVDLEDCSPLQPRYP